jgi:hypothetical protein
MIQTLKFEIIKRRETLEQDDGVTALEASICTIICKNSAFKKKPQNIYVIVEPISPEA